jgi:hypothetical protein
VIPNVATNNIINSKPTFNQYNSLGVFNERNLILNILMLFVIEMKVALLDALLKVYLSLGPLSSSASALLVIF